MVDITALQQAYHGRTIDNIGLILRERNAADALKMIAPNAALQNLMQKNEARHSVEKYIVDHMLRT